MSKRTKCLKCGHKVEPDAERCPHCGAYITTHYSTLEIWLILLVVIAAAIAYLVAGLSRHRYEGPSVTPAGSLSGIHAVAYQGGCVADLTFQDASGSTQKAQDVNLPWSLDLRVPSGFFASISAQNTCPANGVSCKLPLDDRVVKESESIGANAPTSCSGSVP